MLHTLNKKYLLAGAIFCANALTVSAVNLDDSINQGVSRLDKAQSHQQKVDNVDLTTQQAQREYRAVTKQVDGLQVYIEQLDKQLTAQDDELYKIDESIRQVTIIERQITPLMLRMIDAIDQFVQADVPFLKIERQERVSKLKNMMGRSDVTVAEKYRKVMEAYQTELDYGRTIESYRGELEINGQVREVDFLRTGRIALSYKTLDAKELGMWNNTDKKWQDLDPVFKSNVIKGIRIAREQTAPDLIKIPLAAPTAVTSEISASIATSLATSIENAANKEIK